MSHASPPPRRLALGLLAVVLTSVGCSYTSRSALPATPVSAQSSTLLAADGTPIFTFHAEENRRVVPLEEIPLHVRDAVVAIEDERFYRHHGVDLRAIARAVRANTEAGGVAEGGSTITQQYVKKVLLADSTKTVERKLQEASLALQLERHYSKDRILELYLNAVYFGNGAYGVEAAAEQYFAKPVADLSLAEGALLAGLIQRPSADDPYDNPDAALARRDVVLERMRRNHFAADVDVDAALHEPLTLGSPTLPAAEQYQAAYFVEEVKGWILHDPRFGATPKLRRDLLFGGGLKIQTTVDPKAQADAEAAADAILPDATHDPDVALVSIEPRTGFVRAMVGGRSFFGAGGAAKLNLATQGRQAGSSFKPLVLAAALEEGITPARTYDAPGCITIPVDPPWRPCNYSDSEAAGITDLVEATVHSYNTVFAQLMVDVGPKDAMEAATSYGIKSPLKAVPSAVLGSNEVTAVDMASAYATFANRGVAVTPVLVTRITRSDGTVLFAHEHRQKRVLDADVADTLTAILRQVIERGTGTAAALGRPAAGKTGTADDHHDAWFVGYTPELATAVWVGFHGGQVPMEPPTTPIKVTGGSYPARIWQRFMFAALDGRPPTAFHDAPPDAFVGTGADPGTTTESTLDPASPPGTDTDIYDQIDDYYAEHPPDGGDSDAPTSTTTSTTRPRPTTTVAPARIVAVPDVTGRQVGDATARLRAAGFDVSRRSATGPFATGTVVNQSPGGGSLATEGSTVTIGVVGG
jgi:penicillin-binding protein 1A